MLKQFVLLRVGATDRVAVEHHLSNCAQCAALLDTISSDLGRTATAPERQGTHSAESLFSAASIAPAIPTGPFQIGEKVGGYRIESLIGSGGMGVVYRALDTALGRRVAIKVTRNSLAAAEEAALRLHREAQIIASLEHPNIVPIYHANTHRGTLYLVMPLLKGETLRSRLDRSGPLCNSTALAFCRQIALGLSAAHDAGLVHRDIKPENIWVDEGGTHVRILDFGLAAFTSNTAGLTAPGAVLGTPRYMSPEQASGHAADASSDIFSLGAVLYHMLAGVPPFTTAESVPALLRSIVHDSPPRLSDRNAAVPQEIERLVAQMLEKSPDQRPASAGAVVDLVDDLEHRTESRGGEARNGDANRKIPLLGAALLFSLAFLALGAIVVRMETATGEVVLRFSGSSEAVRVDVREDNVIQTVDPRDDRPIEIRVDTAAGQLVLKKDGFEVLTKSFSLQHPDGRSLTAEFLPSQRPAPEAPSAHPHPHPRAKIGDWKDMPETPQRLTLPFSRKAAADSQQEWADFLGVPLTWTNSVGMQFRLVPPGTYQMGMQAEDVEYLISLGPEDVEWVEMCSASTPPTRVEIDRPFYLSVHEVTQAQYAAVTGDHPSYYSPGGDGATEAARYDTDNAPVESVTWFESVAFCNQLSQIEGANAHYLIRFGNVTSAASGGYRLPRDAEWEWACRSGCGESQYPGPAAEAPFGQAWTRETTRLPRLVGQLTANGFGLFDMLGNVCEWCEDMYLPLGQEDGCHAHLRVTRGFHFLDAASKIRVGFRGWGMPDAKWRQTGFRVALSIPLDGEARIGSSGGARQAQSFAEIAAQMRSVEVQPPRLTVPFPDEVARDSQVQLANAMNVPATFTNRAGIEFALVPPGKYAQGINQAEYDFLQVSLAGNERRLAMIETCVPQQEVEITKPFYVSTHEITQEQFTAIVGTNPSFYAATGGGEHLVRDLDAPHRPVENVTFLEAIAYCNALSQQEMLSAHYHMSGGHVKSADSGGYRLPTEAEWEWACRAGTDTPRYFTAAECAHLKYFSWSEGTTSCPRMVCQLRPNAFGLYDMYGNVGEWVFDWHQEHRELSPEALRDPSGPAHGSHRRIKGNLFAAPWQLSQSGYHGWGAMDYRFPEIGFRIAISLP